ncbi:aldolase-type tim barrel [Lucifera butyrica]|uniref:Aldolase-type tim barrel n=1 Tax=Lucifera butyrica TaxID=1351585 RepID=A0A498R4X7_9FIRM|nr:aldolase-type tim barrel [Lucifera butyrica]
MKLQGVIAKVVPGSIAAETGLVPGDKLLAVNEQPLQDIIDLSFSLAEEVIELLIEKTNGEQEIIEIEKEYDEELGIEFENAVFDQVRCCANQCIFCFVDQMPAHLRASLYVKDDDYRLSFLYGNFITLTNLTEQDINRIQRLHLSPLYVSVHTTDGQLRAQMVGSKKAANIMSQLTRLVESGIELHTQIVLCPGMNDGAVLEQTVRDLFQFQPHILSVAVVPVGLTQFRETCYPLRVFTAEEAANIIKKAEQWQQEYYRQSGSYFVYLADEFYLAAGYPVPADERYDGFPQLENGVGLVRKFLAEWGKDGVGNGSYTEPVYLDVVCGMSAEKILRPLLEAVKIPNLHIRLVPVANQFFGPHITVTGLLTGKDIAQCLLAQDGLRTGVIIPGVALRTGEDVFLDDMTLTELETHLKVPVRKAYFAKDLQSLLRRWQ